MSGGTEKPRNMDFMGTSFEKPQNCQPGMRKSDWSTAGKHKMLSKLATQSFNILWLIARNPNFLQPKVPYFNVSRRFATFPDQ